MPNNDVEMLMRVLEAWKGSLSSELERLKEGQENNHAEIMDMFQRAFPEGDLAGHQKFHLQLIEDAKNRRDLRNEVVKKILTGSAWSVLALIGYKIIDVAKGFFHGQ